MMRIFKTDLRWMEEAARKEIAGCRRSAKNGTVLFTPDGVGSYGALWTRDFAYMVPLLDCFDPAEARSAARYLIEGQRADGVVPDRRQMDGISVYEAGGWGHPVALPPLDNSAFLVSLVYEYVTRTSDWDFLKESLLPLHWAMQAIPRSEIGLVWNSPSLPHSPYGFTDTVGKTGNLCFCSLLDWKASKELVFLSERAGNPVLAQLYRSRGKEVEAGMAALMDSTGGLFFAASSDCRQLDVWGNAFAVAIGFPLPPDRKESVIRFFTDRYDDVIEKGQVRHLLKGEFWQRMLIPIARGEYQNGGFWGTASGWVLQTLAAMQPQVAEQLLRELLQDYRTRGIHEWVNGDRVNLPHYVASITNPLAAIKEMIAAGTAIIES